MPPFPRISVDNCGVLVDLTQLIFSPMPGGRPYTNNHAHKKLNAKGVSESISPLPNFRKRLSVCESAGLGECVSVYLYRKLLVLTDDTGGDSLSEVNVFGVGAPVQYICSAACTKQLPFPSIVSSKNEVPSRNDLDISRTFGELLTINQLPGTIQLTLLCVAAVCL